ncbi:MAG TPA: chloride channel protein [Marmoricola sp.]|jgi:CIC family chloride channel protein|nr:chloride channel protein [Marmoricola sp.]
MSVDAATPTRRDFGWVTTATEWARTSSGGLLASALTVGATAGLFAVGFRWLIKGFTLALTGHVDYAAVPGAASAYLPALGPWFVLGTPVVAGLLYGPLVYFFAPEARGHGVPEVMFAVAKKGGRIPPQVAGVKALASALCLGGGGSVGREGPIVQIGSALGSTLGRILRMPEPRLRVLVACGAAGGIAATFNAPLAGVFFAMELILANFAPQSFGMVVLASVTASVIGRAFLGDEPFLRLPAFTVTSPAEFALFAVLGVLAGVVGVGFTRVLYAIEDLCDAVWRGPEWLRPAVGGLGLGVLLLLVPQMYGVGYPVLGNAIAHHYALGFLVVLLLSKMVATSLTIGIGGSGGVFAPSLFIGAMLGSGFGEVAQHLAPGSAGPVGAYGLIGMGAVFAGAARAPITAVVILFELTGEYSIILPLMMAIVLATGVSHVLSSDTIYTLKLRRRGVALGVVETIATAAPVASIMRQAPAAIASTADLESTAAALARSAYGVLPIEQADGSYGGVLTAREVADALSEPSGRGLTAGDLVERPTTIRPTDDIHAAIDALDSSGCGAVPVLQDGTIVGWVDYSAALQGLRSP